MVHCLVHLSFSCVISFLSWLQLVHPSIFLIDPNVLLLASGTHGALFGSCHLLLAFAIVAAALLCSALLSFWCCFGCLLLPTMTAVEDLKKIRSDILSLLYE